VYKEMLNIRTIFLFLCITFVLFEHSGG